MLLTVKIVSALLLIVVLAEDLKHRAVHAWLFPALFAAFAFVRLQEIPFAEWLAQTGMNLGLLLLNLLLATLYFSIKNKKPVLLTGNLIGWGDILFFVCLSALFDFPVFALFFPVSLLFSLLTWLLIARIKSQASLKVPLAGLQALFVVVWLVATETGVFPSPDFYTAVL